jgi:hypothetical protein
VDRRERSKTEIRDQTSEVKGKKAWSMGREAEEAGLKREQTSEVSQKKRERKSGRQGSRASVAVEHKGQFPPV